MSGEKFAVVGAGILGAAVARALLLRRPGCTVDIIEKERRPALHQTGRNSGVVHAGLYYTPGSNKAVLVRKGVRLLREYCEDNNLDYIECGKVLVATNARERERLVDIHERAEANAVPGVRLLDAAGLADIEPHAVGIAALHSPTTAIVDFGSITRTMISECISLGATVRYGHQVSAFHHGDTVRIETIVEDGQGTDVLGPFDRVVLCAGLHADRLARLAGDDEYPRIVPFRGDFAVLRAHRNHLVNGLIYPVPDPRYPFLGIHLTKRTDGGVSVGPNALLALAREAYTGGAADWRGLLSLARWSGFRRFARRNWRAGVSEWLGSVSARRFANEARRLVPELTVRDIMTAPSGIRAQAMDRDGTLVDDFRLSRQGNVLCVRNAPSPAATASLAIADHLVDQLFSNDPSN